MKARRPFAALAVLGLAACRGHARGPDVDPQGYTDTHWVGSGPAPALPLGRKVELELRRGTEQEQHWTLSIAEPSVLAVSLAAAPGEAADAGARWTTVGELCVEHLVTPGSFGAECKGASPGRPATTVIPVESGPVRVRVAAPARGSGTVKAILVATLTPSGASAAAAD